MNPESIEALIMCFSASPQCPESANEAQRLTCLVRCGIQYFSKSALILLYKALAHLRFKYGMAACSTNLMAYITHLE